MLDLRSVMPTHAQRLCDHLPCIVASPRAGMRRGIILGLLQENANKRGEGRRFVLHGLTGYHRSDTHRQKQDRKAKNRSCRGVGLRFQRAALYFGLDRLKATSYHSCSERMQADIITYIIASGVGKGFHRFGAGNSSRPPSRPRPPHGIRAMTVGPGGEIARRGHTMLIMLGSMRSSLFSPE